MGTQDLKQISPMCETEQDLINLVNKSEKIINEFLVGIEQSYNDFWNAVSTIYFIKLLEVTKGNVTEASKRSKIGRPYLYKMLKAYGLNPDMFRKLETLQMRWMFVDYSSMAKKRYEIPSNRPDKS